MKFLKKIFSPSLLIISLFFLFYTFYKSEIYFDGKKSDYYSIYYIISGSILILTIISFFLNQKIKEYLIICTLSIVFTLYLYETYLAIKYEKSQIDKFTLLKQNNSESKLEFYENLKKKNEKTVLAVSPSSFLNEETRLFPLSGISNSKTINCNENGYFSVHKSDRYGFNNPDSEWDEENIEYLLVGDSFAYGACVNPPDDISNVLRILSNRKVLNIAYGGNGPLIEYASLKEFLNEKVKKVLWVYYEGNDQSDLKRELKNDVLRKYLKDNTFSQELKNKQNKVDILTKDKMDASIEDIFKYEINSKKNKNLSFAIIKFIKLYNLRSMIFKNSEPEPQNEFKKLLSLTKNLAEKNNSKLYFIYLPEYNHYKPFYNDTNYFAVKRILEELKIPLIDIHEEVFKKETNPRSLFPFELPGHYNVKGYKKIAEAIYRRTKN